MDSFNSVDIILFLGVSQGLFLAVSLYLAPNKNKSANNILSLTLLIATAMLFGRIMAYRIPVNWVWRLGVFVDTIIFLFGPFVYMYVRRLIFQEIPVFRLKWFHFIPAGLHIGYYSWTLTFPLVEFNQLYASGKLNLMFFIVEVCGLSSLIFYWLKTTLLIEKYKKEEKEQLSFHQSVFRFLKFFSGALFLIICLWLLSFFSANFFGKTFSFINYETMWTSLPVFIYAVGYFSLSQPEIFRIPVHQQSKPKKDRLKPEEIKRLQKRLQYYMSEERIFLEPNLTLKGLSDKLNTSSNNLSWLLNQIYQASFYDFINNYRIKEFIIKVEKNEHQNHTFLAIAMDVGFNSKSTFNKAFKAYTGNTPSNYIKAKNVA